jgi:NAD-dependent DNA ligase
MGITIPTNCPSCGHLLKLTNDQLFCYANDCPAQSSKKLVSFCKTLKIKGFGEKTVEKLDFTDIIDLDKYTVAYAVDKGISPKVAQNLQDELDKMSKCVDFNTFLAAFGIPLIGATASRKLAETANSIDELTMESLGDKAQSNLENFINTLWKHKYSQGLGFIKISEKKTVTLDKAARGDVCISGKLNGLTKAQAELQINEAGFTVKSSLTKSCLYLISEDGKESSKVKKAKSTNITIITLEELLNV